MNFPYEDIISLPHPVSTRHSRMTNTDRAAQFSSFAALSGHEEAIAETARLTIKNLNLDEQTLMLEIGEYFIFGNIFAVI